MNTMAMNAADWANWALDHHLPGIVCAVAIVFFMVLDLRRPDE